jgi:hypothetical protein
MQCWTAARKSDSRETPDYKEDHCKEQLNTVVNYRPGPGSLANRLSDKETF